MLQRKKYKHEERSLNASHIAELLPHRVLPVYSMHYAQRHAANHTASMMLTKVVLRVVIKVFRHAALSFRQF